jgi:hypothetical protein
MADNVTLNAGAGGATCATDDVGGVQFQKVKLDIGADGVSLPVAGALPVSAAALPLPAGAATEATLSALNGKVTAVDTGAVVVALSNLPVGAATEASLAAMNAKIPAQGQGLMAASVPVAIASNQSAVAVSAAALPLPAGASTAALQGGGLPAALGAGGGLKIDGSGTALPITGTITAVTAITNALPAGDNNIGNVDVLSVIPGTGATNLGKAEDAQHSSGDVGVMLLGVRNEDNEDFSGDDNDYIPIALDATGDIFTRMRHAIPAGSGLIGDVALQPRAAGGNTPYSRLSTATTNAVSIVATQTNLLGGWITNINAAPRYVKLYNKASAPDPAADTPVLRLLIPGNTNGAGGVCNIPSGIQFSLGLAMLIVTGVGDTDATAVAANEIIVNLWYKS